MVLLAVVSSIAASLAVFCKVSVDVYYAVIHLSVTRIRRLPRCAQGAARWSCYTCGRSCQRCGNGVMLIFALGLYELFISDIWPVVQRRRADSGHRDADDLKTKLAKVILDPDCPAVQYAAKLRPESHGAGLSCRLHRAGWPGPCLTHASEGRTSEETADDASTSQRLPAPTQRRQH
jgi:hypothetical protein